MIFSKEWDVSAASLKKYHDLQFLKIQHIKSRILPTVLEIKNMVNEMREKQNERDTESLRSNFSNSTLSLNNLNQKVQESKRLSRNIQVIHPRSIHSQGLLPNYSQNRSKPFFRMHLIAIVVKQHHHWSLIHKDSMKISWFRD